MAKSENNTPSFLENKLKDTKDYAAAFEKFFFNETEAGKKMSAWSKEQKEDFLKKPVPDQVAEVAKIDKTAAQYWGRITTLNLQKSLLENDVKAEKLYTSSKNKTPKLNSEHNSVKNKIKDDVKKSPSFLENRLQDTKDYATAFEKFFFNETEAGKKMSAWSKEQKEDFLKKPVPDQVAEVAKIDKTAAQYWGRITTLNLQKSLLENDVKAEKLYTSSKNKTPKLNSEHNSVKNKIKDDVKKSPSFLENRLQDTKDYATAFEKFFFNETEAGKKMSAWSKEQKEDFLKKPVPDQVAEVAKIDKTAAQYWGQNCNP